MEHVHIPPSASPIITDEKKFTDKIVKLLHQDTEAAGGFAPALGSNNFFLGMVPSFRASWVG